MKQHISIPECFFYLRDEDLENFSSCDIISFLFFTQTIKNIDKLVRIYEKGIFFFIESKYFRDALLFIY